MPFRAYLKEIELRPEEVVMPLLAEVRRYANMDTAPGSRGECGDCRMVE